MVDATVVWALLGLSLEPTSSGLQFGLKPTKIPDKKTSKPKNCKIQTFILFFKYANGNIWHFFAIYNLNLLKMHKMLTLFDPGPTCISAAVPRFSL